MIKKMKDKELKQVSKLLDKVINIIQKKSQKNKLKIILIMHINKIIRDNENDFNYYKEELCMANKNDLIF